VKAAVDREEYLKKRDEYFKHVDPAVLRELNKRNAVKGKGKIVRPRTDSYVRVPLNGYMRLISFLLWSSTSAQNIFIIILNLL